MVARACAYNGAVNRYYMYRPLQVCVVAYFVMRTLFVIPYFTWNMMII